MIRIDIKAFLLVVLFSACWWSGVFAQSIVEDVAYADYNIHIEGWTLEDGYPYRKLTLEKDLVQDSRGFIWIAPHASLVRFDGKKFQEFTPDYSVGTVINRIVEDRYGNLWLSTPAAQEKVHVFIINEERFVKVTEYLGLLGQDTGSYDPLDVQDINQLGTTIYLENKERTKIWAFGKEMRLVYRHGTGKPTKGILLPVSDNRFWNITEEDGTTVKTVDSVGNPSAYYHFPSNFRLESIYVDDNLKPWKLTDNWFDLAYQRRNNATLDEFIVPADGLATPSFPERLYGHGAYQNFLSSIILYPQLIKTGRTAYLLDQDRSFLIDLDSVFVLADIPHDLYVRKALATDRLEFWCASSGGLMHVTVEPKWFRTEFERNSVRDITYADGSIFVMGYAFAGFSKDLDTRKDITYPMGDVYSIFPDGSKVWFGGNDNTIHVYDSTATQPFSSIRQFPYDPYAETRILGRYDENSLLIGSLNGLVRYYPATNTADTLLNDRGVNWSYQDERNNYWLATSRGVYHLDERNYYFEWNNGKPLKVNHLAEVAKNEFWLATDQGLVHAHTRLGILGVIDQHDGLPSAFVHAVYPDRSGILWLSTDNGVSAFDPLSCRIQNFFESDGLASNEQNFYAHDRADDGRLFFGGTSGITSFYPDSIPLFQPRLRHGIHLGTVRLFDRRGNTLPDVSIDPDGSSPLVIPASSSQFVIPAILPHYRNSNLVFEYRIPGFTPSWTPIDNNEVRVSGLPKGTFGLQIRAVDTKAASDSILRKLAIKRKVYFYENYTFWGIAFLVFCGLAWRAYRWRTRKMLVEANKLKEIIDERTHELSTQKSLIEAQNADLRQSSKAKNQMFNNLSHEFRTPLSLIIGHADKLEKQIIFPADASGEVVKIRRQARELHEMIDELLDLTRIDAGMISIQREVVNWHDFVTDQFNLFIGLAQQKQLNYLLRLEGDDPTATVAVDRKLLGRILQNFITNAIKFTPPRGRVIVTGGLADATLGFSVEDNGPGIPPAEIPRLFNRFYRGKDADQLQQAGFGVGLSICKEYARLLGGHVAVSSQLGHGSRFTFELPDVELTPSLSPHPPAPEPAAAAQPKSITLPGPRDKFLHHVLVVEDNRELKEMLLQLLSPYYRVTGVENGRAALDYLETNGPVDLVLSDVMMPLMDGKELLRRLRLHPDFRHLPFLILTAISDPDFKTDLIRLGADGFLLKPFDIEALLARVSNLLQNHALRTNSTPATIDAPPPSPPRPDDTAEDRPEHANEWMERLNAFLESEFHRTDLKVSDFSRHMNVSERTFRTHLARLTGMKPSEYITATRLRNALRLLQKGRYRTVAEVARHCGFKNPDHFSVAFKKAFGKPPSEYLYR